MGVPAHVFVFRVILEMIERYSIKKQPRVARQPRTTPWVEEQRKPCSPERANDVSAKNILVRPFRAARRWGFLTWGSAHVARCTPGYRRAPLQGFFVALRAAIFQIKKTLDTLLFPNPNFYFFSTKIF